MIAVPGPHPQWRKSTHSGSGDESCCELADLGRTVGIRDSKNRDGPALTITRSGLAGLVTTIKTA